MKQTTIARSFSLRGLGIHSGKLSELTLKPAAAGSGIFFSKEGRTIPAFWEKVTDTRRGTTLGGIAVVEHLLSAVNGLGINNLEIAVVGDEVPIMDGSALPFVEALRSAGLAEQELPVNYIEVAEPVKVTDGNSSLEALPFRGLKVDFMVDFPVVGQQRLVFEAHKDDYAHEIAPARTFGFIENHEELKSAGRGMGATLENALVIGKDGYINQPRFPDEVVRHKILDLLGDITLLGRPLQAELRATRSGHKMNFELIRRLLENG